jgi:MarR family transcriptional regulator, lower aerobic nicotinate degradation pathway regulator
MVSRGDEGGPPLEARVGYLLFRLGRTQSSLFVDALEPLGMRPKHFALMNLADLSEGSSQQELGRKLGLDSSGLVSVIDDLEAQGLVERRRDATDRRRYAIHLTRAGKTKLSRAREAVTLRAEELLAPLSEDERETLHDLLARVAAAGERDLRPLA